MERGQTQRTQLDHELWKCVCQDTGIPLKLAGWEGNACTEGLQTLCAQALKHLKHTLPKALQQRIDQQAAADSGGSGSGPPSAARGDRDAEGSSSSSSSPSSSSSSSTAAAAFADATTHGDGDGVGPIISFNYHIDKSNSAFQNLKKFAKFCALHCGMQQPLCAKSTLQAVAALKAEYGELERAHEHYKNYLRIIEAAEQLRLLYKPESVVTPEEELAELKRKIARRRTDIAAVKALRKQAHASSGAVAAKTARVKALYERTLQQLRQREADRYRNAQIQQSLCTKIRVAQVKAYHLKRTNIFNDCFFIWHQGPFATINGNRLGRLPANAGPQHQVDYPEINAAWGCAALLLYLTGAYHAAKTAKGQTRFAFKEYDIRPMGSNSTLVLRSKNKPKDLFSGGWTLLGRRPYCDAMQGFLSCLQDLYLHIQQSDPSARVPYEIHEDKIGGLSIRNLGDLVAWTEACKYTLTNLKWLVAFTAKA